MTAPAPLPLPPAAGVSAQPGPAAGVPGAPLGPDDDLDPIQMEMMIQQAMYDLLQRPIIPDPLVFVCAALYLIIVMTLLIAGAFYFTNRLQPPPPPTPPEETETTAKYTEPEAETTPEVKAWSTPSDKNPFICIIGLQHKSNSALVKSLVDSNCGTVVMKENLDFSNGAVTLQGTAHTDKEVGKLLSTEFGTDIGSVGAGLECCSLVFEPDLGMTLFGVDDLPFSGACKVRLRPNVDLTAATEYIDNQISSCSTYVIADIAEASEAEINRLSPVLSIGRVDFVIFAPSRMTTESLAKLRMSLLPNSYQELTAGDGKALAAVKKAKKVCLMFTVAAMKSVGIATSSTNPVNQTVQSVEAVSQSTVCQAAGLINDKRSMTYYRKGNDLISLDTIETLSTKVRAVLKKNTDVCIAAYDVQFDDCDKPEKNSLTRTIFKVFNKELRRR